MELRVKIDDVRQNTKLFVAAPMYGGQCSGMFCKSTNDLAKLFEKHNLEIAFYYLFNESLITRARNYCVDEFLRSDYTHLLFIDSDIGFNANDVLAMLSISEGVPDLNDGNPFDILCAPYPKKCIAWEKIKQAVDMGVADEDPNVLNRFVGDYVFNPASGNEIRLDIPQEVMEGGTGFMLIRRETFERFADNYPNLSYKPDHVRTANFDGSREILAYFDALIDDNIANLDKEIEALGEDATAKDVLELIRDKKSSKLFDGQYSNRYLSEDYMFCQWVRRIGMKVWLCPWIELQHVGTYTFGGSLPDLASIRASATADESKLKKS